MQINELYNNISSFLKRTSESLLHLGEVIKQSFVVANAKNSTDSRKRKAYMIYHKTKKKRIKKKQLTIMEG